MTDRDALLRSVCAHPDADAPRLVYADWLEEHGDPERAEFIRLQCELAELAEDGSDSQAVFASLELTEGFKEIDWEPIDPGIARRVALRQRVTALKSRQGKAWKDADAPKDAGVGWVGWERGFPATAKLRSAPDLGRAAGDLFERVPLTRLVVVKPTGATAYQLASPEVGSQLRAFELHGPVGEFLTVLGASPAAAGIRELSCHSGQDADDVARTLAAAPGWHGLRRLDLRNAGEMSPAAAEELFAAKHLRGLTELRVHGGGSARAVHALVKNHITELHTLELFLANLGDEEAEALAGCAALKTLRTLELPSNRITGRGATALLTSPRLKHLAVLNLSHNRVRKLDAQALARGGRATLRALNLESNDLTADDLGALGAAPALRGLLWLSVEKNDLGDRALAKLAATAGPKHLAVLNLIDNAAGDAGVTALADWPGLKHVRCLHLNGNAFGPTGARALAASPLLDDLAHLCFDKAKVGAAVRDLQKRFSKAAKPQ